MEKSSTGTGRRTLLQRALALVAGGVALGSGVRLTGGNQVHAMEIDGSFTVYARMRPFAAPPNGKAAPSVVLAASGELLDGPEGKSIGSFVSNCFCDGSGVAHNVVHPGLTFQALQLRDGTLYGMCSGASANGSKSHAIVGGTGRFAGARGAYIETAAAGAGGRMVVQFVVTLSI